MSRGLAMKLEEKAQKDLARSLSMVDLENMTAADLDELRLTIYDQAVEQGLIGLCFKIAEELGQETEFHGLRVYEAENIRFEHFSTTGTLIIRLGYNDKVLASTRHDDLLFVPGPWVERLAPTLERARTKAEELASNEEREKRAMLLNNLCYKV